MPYITRDDGEHFVIPSYRDIITAKNAATLKKEIQILSKSYGEYVTLQRINPVRFEAAFSPDTGYLLGESIWHQLKRPEDLVYCEAIPNTMEAILVIVKEGSVYLDGKFPLDSIPEELIIFLTQRNHFEIYTYGDVPISQTPVEGKFNFEPSSVKTFTELEKPLFPTLPLLKMYQLQLIDPVLAGLGIGGISKKKMAVIAVIFLALWLMWTLMTSPTETVTQIIAAQINPYQVYDETLTSPAPDVEMNQVVNAINLLVTMPGWAPTQLSYTSGNLTASVLSDGTSIATLQNWAKRNFVTIDIDAKGVRVTVPVRIINRPAPTTIYPLKQVIVDLTDKLAFVYPGNVLRLGTVSNKGPYVEELITVNINSSTPAVIALIGDQFKGLPLVLQSLTLLQQDKGFFSGTINLKALGS